MTMQRESWTLLAVLVFISAMPYLWPYLPFAADALGKGTDDGARNAIHEVAPAFEPWMETVWSPPDSNVERLLFTLQAVGGALLLYGSMRMLRKSPGSGELGGGAANGRS